MKQVLVNVLILCMCFLCGCSFSKNEKSDNKVNNESEEVSYVSFDELSSVDKEAAKWETMCETVICDIKSLDWVVSVEITPCNYEEYVQENNISIICETDGSEDGAQKIIEDYIKAVNFFEEYEIVVD